MRLSGEETLVDHGGPPTTVEMRQKNLAFVDPLVNRPQVYYGDGPFDPPSSDDEEEVAHTGNIDDDAETISLLSGPATPGRAERGETGPRRTSEAEQKNSSIRVLAIILFALVSLATIIGILAGFSHPGTSYLTPGGRGLLGEAGRKRLTMDSIFDGTFAASQPSLNWVAEAGDGVFSLSEGGFIRLVDLKTNTTANIVATADVKDERGNTLTIDDWKLSHDTKYLLIKTNYRKQWRHSGFSNYYIHNIEEKRSYPVTQPSFPAQTAYATWAPTGNALAYVLDNDLYILPSAEPATRPIRVTSTGNTSLFHGVPDWVYEEEVFSSDFSLWWSPDASKVAFLTLDETAVPEFTFPIYNPTEDSNAVIPYTTEVVMKYPKPGYPNPLASLQVFDLAAHLDNSDAPPEDSTLTLDWDGRHSVDDSIIQEVNWIGNTTLIVKEVNRNADDGNVILFQLDANSAQSQDRGRVVRKLGKNGEQGDDGWIDADQFIFPVPASVAGYEGTNSYLDIVPTKEGYNHIALFSPGDSSQPIFLTSGEWEVTGGIRGVGVESGLVYFTAAKPSTERHLFSIPLPPSSSAAATEKPAEPKPLTDASNPSIYGTSFSPEAGFYVLTYTGPDIPWTKVYDTSRPSFEYVLELNEQLRNATLEYEAATTVHTTFTNEGFEFNVKELRPPRMDDSGRRKYPVLFRVYGGPASQLVDQRFTRDWHHYLACAHSYVIVTVDGRGTGYKGRKLRNTVKNNLGFFETVDQIAAAK
ncbi:hypothetical protein NLJ89_g4948 [Agrocybe chaxingu]|uniref:Dipeptidylpeptidase IV N-terminal domain-containing protein n=1 Tax=Agrocybe chaxingu TaxID=84603 RepID=A0A9W8K1Z0_9AGAR|nr:hypothetical protein NLJ89_g4948 [Agrocybe chaxingu]